MIKKLLFTALILMVAFVIVVLTRPSSFRVSRSTVIAAPPAAVFANVNELKKWEAWNPWGKIDPKTKMTYEGPAAGVGASYAWDSPSNEVGAGKNTITESKPGERVRFRLEFFRPMAGVNDTLFTFQPEGAGTRVTWTMSGDCNFVAKAIGLFIDCDKMVGDQFAKGLADMKAVVEGGGAK